jgi:hypothetical protein
MHWGGADGNVMNQDGKPRGVEGLRNGPEDLTSSKPEGDASSDARLTGYWAGTDIYCRQ